MDTLRETQDSPIYSSCSKSSSKPTFLVSLGDKPWPVSLDLWAIILNPAAHCMNALTSLPEMGWWMKAPLD